MITSLQNDRVKHWVKLRHNRDYRYDHQKVLIEGKKTIAELCRHFRPITFIATHEDLIPPEQKEVEVVLVTEPIMAKITEEPASEGILAEIGMPEQQTLKTEKWVVALDGINDPGNLGTLIRTALALGWEGVFLLENSCDPYNDKALRAAKGATFHLPIVTGTWKDLQDFAKAKGLTLVAADMKGENPSSIVSKGTVLILGSEARGLSPTIASSAKKVGIPMDHKMESLNVAVAGGILMYLLHHGGSHERGR